MIRYTTKDYNIQTAFILAHMLHEKEGFTAPLQKQSNIYLERGCIQVIITPESLSIVNRGCRAPEGEVEHIRRRMRESFSELSRVLREASHFYKAYKGYVSEKE